MNRLPAIVAQLAKAPVEGRVKTRMSAVLSPAQCVELHQFLTTTVFHNLVCDESWIGSAREEQWDYEISYDHDHPFFDDLSARYSVNKRQQHDGDLGQRLLAIQLAHPQRITVLIGSDCPFLSRADIRALISALSGERFDFAIVPAHDGGYVALACRQPFPALFAEVDWGSENVFAQTLENAKKAGLRSCVFESKHDIDRPEDLALIPKFKQN